MFVILKSSVVVCAVLRSVFGVAYMAAIKRVFTPSPLIFDDKAAERIFLVAEALKLLKRSLC